MRVASGLLLPGALNETDLGGYDEVAGVWFPFSVESGEKGKPRNFRLTIERGEANSGGRKASSTSWPPLKCGQSTSGFATATWIPITQASLSGRGEGEGATALLRCEAGTLTSCVPAARASAADLR